MSYPVWVSFFLVVTGHTGKQQGLNHTRHTRWPGIRVNWLGMPVPGADS